MTDAEPTEACSERPSCYISQIKFNNDKTVDIAENDIIVFVGSNNNVEDYTVMS